MQIEFIKHKELEFNNCLCNGHDNGTDIRAMGWITSDYKTPYGTSDLRACSEELVQFPWTYSDYIRSSYKKFTCHECGRHLYRIVRNPAIR